ncbi:MAG: hypothetical protein ACREAW_05265, partial [Nitrososphaera sp.]
MTVKSATKIEIDVVDSEYENNLINLRARLVDNDTDGGYSGRTLTVTTSSSSGIQNVTTAGIHITGPSGSTQLVIDHCTTLGLADSPPPLEDCARDEGQADDDNSNEVLRAEPDTVFEFGEGHKQVNFFVTGVGKASFVIEFTNAANPTDVATNTYTVEEGSYTIAGHQFVTGVGSARFVSITQLDGSTNPVLNTLGISRIITYNAQGAHPVLFDEDFERYSSVNSLPLVSSLPAAATVSDGFAFPVVQMPGETLVVTAGFAGDSTLQGSIATQQISLLDTDLAANAGIFNPTSDSGISSTFSYIACAVDSDKDGICDADEVSGYIDTAGGRWYICPGGSQANPNQCGLNKYHKNAFIEYDYYTGRALNSYVTSELVNMFANLNVQNPDQTKGVTLTIQKSDELTLAAGFPAVMNVWISNNGIAFDDFDNTKQRMFGTSGERGAISLLKDNQLLQRKAMIYKYMIVGNTLGAGPSVNCNEAAYGTSEDPPGTDIFVGLGCSPHGAADPNYPGTKFSNQYEILGVVAHEVGHSFGLHHNGPVKTANLEAITLNAGLTQTSASKAGSTSVTKPSSTSVKVSGNTISATGPYEGFLRIDTTLTLSGAATITVGAVTKNTSPGASLNMETPYVIITSGAGLSSQTLSWYFPIKTSSSVSGLSMGAWTVQLSISGGKTISSVALKAGSPVMTNLVPPGIYSQNCVPQHIGVMSYSMMDPRYVDKAAYYLADGVTFNAGYTPTNWKPRYTSGWYGPINENAVIETQGIKEAFYQTSQKLVYAYQGAVQRVSGIGSTWVSVPAWIDFDGKADVDSAAQVLDLNHFGRAGCSATPGEMLRGNFAEDRNMIFIPTSAGGLVDSRSGHGDDTQASTTPITITTSGFLSPI